MNTFKKWLPHLHPKLKRIVSVTFEDGATIQTDEAELRGYLKCIDDRREEAEFRKLGLLPPRQQRAVWRELNRLWASERASGPRKNVTKAQLIAFRNGFVRDEDASRGWKKAACLQFRITLKTLNRRMVE